MRRPATASRSYPASAGAAATLMPKRSPVVGSRRRRPPNVALSLGRFVGGRPVVVVWVVEDGERWGQQEAILITTGSACLIHGAGGESEQLVEDVGGWVVRQRAQRSADHADAGGQPERCRDDTAPNTFGQRRWIGGGERLGDQKFRLTDVRDDRVASDGLAQVLTDRDTGAVGAGFPGDSG